MLLGAASAPSGDPASGGVALGTDSQFSDIVQKLMGESSSEVKADDVKAGQQEKDADSSDTKVDAKIDEKIDVDADSSYVTAQMQLLLGSSGIVNEVPKALSENISKSPESALESDISDIVVDPTVSERKSLDSPVMQGGVVSEETAKEADIPKISKPDAQQTNGHATENNQKIASSKTADVAITESLIDGTSSNSASAGGSAPVKPSTTSEYNNVQVNDQYLVQSGKTSVQSGIQFQPEVGSLVNAVQSPDLTDTNDLSDGSSKDLSKATPLLGDKPTKSAEQPIGSDSSESSNAGKVQPRVLLDTHRNSVGDKIDRILNSKSKIEVKPDNSLKQNTQTDVDESLLGLATPTVNDTPIPVQTSEISRSGYQAQRSQSPVDSARVINQIVKAAKVNVFDGGGDIVLRLDPPHLGTLQMNVTMENGAVNATIQASTEQARNVLQNDMVTLRQSLSDAGINVDQISVHVGTNTNYGSGNHSASANAWLNDHRRSHGGTSTGGDRFGTSAEITQAVSDAYQSRATSQINFLA